MTGEQTNELDRTRARMTHVAARLRSMAATDEAEALVIAERLEVCATRLETILESLRGL